ncbi:hypothetical protein BLOT_006404 [Blomia tropicalis]|nr:hypothetical protein BLOT_006404 [Blomia tropicalis]
METIEMNESFKVDCLAQLLDSQSSGRSILSFGFKLTIVYIEGTDKLLFQTLMVLIIFEMY